MVNTGEFKFESCLMKHYVRREGWLPACKERLLEIQGKQDKNRPRLKYFTFCATGAIDVVMLDLEKVVRASGAGAFDTVYYFDVDDAQVARTRESIPGAIGFPGDFVDIVLAEDPLESQVTDVVSSLEPPVEETFTRHTREQIRRLAIRREFIKAFPFDVINLDLERYLFIPKEALPGKLVNAFRKVFEWQRKRGQAKGGSNYSIDGFELMFTVRVGPHELSQEYRDMMLDYVRQNLADDESLRKTFEARFKEASIDDLLKNNFDAFFKLAVPKTILGILREEDWHVDVTKGVKVFEFDRQTAKDPYTMLHLVMTVRRNSPPKEARAPGMLPASAIDAYKRGVVSIFSTDTIKVESALKTVGENKISKHLDAVFRHRDSIGSK